jgi:hypothetical protein
MFLLKYHHLTFNGRKQPELESKRWKRIASAIAKALNAS